jgi:putative ABC transport system permease protein
VNRWRETIREAWTLALDSLRQQTLRSTLAILGVVVGIVTVVLVASVLANLRNQVALLFRELGTDNIFAFHLTGDPYVTPSDRELRRRPLEAAHAPVIARLGRSIRDVGVQVVVPTVGPDSVLIARAGDRDFDRVLVEGASANYLEIVAADFAAGRPFTELEDRVGAPVVVIGSSVARALFDGQPSVGRQLLLGGERYTIVGEQAPRRGGFFGENRQDTVVTMPLGTARRRFGQPERVILYIQAAPGERERARTETEAILRQLRGLEPTEENDFNLSTADQIISIFDEIGAQVALATVALAAVSLVIGGIGIANVMVIGVTERTREIGLRLAVGARRNNVLTQFLMEAALLSTLGGVAGVATALLLGLILTLFLTGFSAVPPLWSVVAGVTASTLVGVVAGFLPARRAAGLDPSEALRHE